MADATHGRCCKREEVKDYYGKVLQQKKDLKSGVCTTPEGLEGEEFRQLMRDIHPEIVKRYYGCGTSIPNCIRGASVLDLGCGSGQDCFMFSKLVGPTGTVTGIDMTVEQIEFAQKYVAFHTDKFGYSSPNVNFITGYIEDLESSGIKSGQFDLTVSNCVVNLSPDKEAVLKEAYRVLKIGGEFYFSDIYADKQLNEEQKKNKVLWGECISGALFWQDFIEIATKCGFSEPRLVQSHIIDIANEELKPLIGDIKFVSATYRLLKLPEKAQEPAQVTYLGTIDGQPEAWTFDKSLRFKVNEPRAADGPTVTFLSSSRFKDHFKVLPKDIPVEDIPKNNVDPFIGLKSCHGSKKSCSC